MNRAHLEAVLVGASLPSSKQELVDYARRQSPDGAEAAASIEQHVPDGTYMTLQDVGEQLQPRQPRSFSEPPPSHLPEEESDLPPGGVAYLGEPQEPANVVATRESG